MACLGEGDAARSLALQHAAAANFQRTVATEPGNWSVQRYLHLLQIARARTLVTAGRMAEAQTMLDSLVAGRWRPASLQAGWRVTGSWPGVVAAGQPQQRPQKKPQRRPTQHACKPAGSAARQYQAQQRGQAAGADPQRRDAGRCTQRQAGAGVSRIVLQALHMHAVPVTCHQPLEVDDVDQAVAVRVRSEGGVHANDC